MDDDTGSASIDLVDSHADDDHSTSDDATVPYSAHSASEDDDREDLFFSTHELSISGKPLVVPAGTRQNKDENNDDRFDDDNMSHLLSSEGGAPPCLAHTHDQHDDIVDLSSLGSVSESPVARLQVAPMYTTSETQRMSPSF